jgi:hypothetical protein
MLQLLQTFHAADPEALKQRLLAEAFPEAQQQHPFDRLWNRVQGGRAAR